MSKDPDQSEAPTQPNARPGLPFFLLALGIVALSVAGIAREWIDQEEKEVARLGAIADLKAGQIADWLDERQREATHLQRSIFLAERYQRWRAGDATSGMELRRRLSDFIHEQGMTAVELFDAEGRYLWGSERTPCESAPLASGMTAAGQTGQTQRLTPFLDRGGKAHIDFVVPLAAGPMPPPIVVLHADPGGWLYGALQTWPVPSESGETLLFRRDGDEVLYLSELRHRKDTALKLRQPLSSQRLLAAQVLLGKARAGKALTGIDYRGMPAIGVARAIAGTDWFLIAKMDDAELHAQALRSALLTGLAGLLALAVATAGMIVLRQRERLAASAAMSRTQDELCRSAADLAEAQRVARIGSWRFDPVRDEVRWSDELYRIFDVDPGEFSGDYAGFLRRVHPDDRDRVRRVNSEARAGKEHFEVEYRILTRAGAERNIREIGYATKDGAGRVVALFGTAQDITDRILADSALVRSEAQLHALTARLQDVREEERGRIAREVHDELGQLLTGLTLDMAWLEKRVDRVDDATLRREMADKLAEIGELTRAMIESMQTIASDLRPSVLDNLGLGPALRFEADRFQARSGLVCVVDAPTDIAPLEDGLATAIFRIFQELLSNIARPAGATRVGIHLTESEQGLRLEVRDDGRGITRAQQDDARSLGLLGMRERAAQIGGRIEFRGEPGQGTTVTLTVPA
jgi:signal transduction histidine kinase